ELRQGNETYARNAAIQQVGLGDVTRALRPGEAVVEYVKYNAFDFATDSWQTAPSYGALVIRADRDAPSAVPLPDEAIDEDVADFRKTMDDWINNVYKTGDVGFSEAGRRAIMLAQQGRAITEGIWDPLKSALEGV